MIRAVLAVLVAVALLGASLPALSDARAATTADRLDAEADRLERAAATLADEATAVDDRELAARTTRSLHVPAGVTAAPVDRAVVGCPETVLDGDGRASASDTEPDPPADCEAAVIYRLRGHDPAVHRFDDPHLTTPDGPVVLRAGETRVTLRLRRVEHDDEARPVVELTRG